MQYYRITSRYHRLGSIVSKDADFRQLAFLHGPPPKVLWLRVGNVRTAEVLEVLVDYRSAIEVFGDEEDGALLVLPALPTG